MLHIFTGRPSPLAGTTPTSGFVLQVKFCAHCTVDYWLYVVVYKWPCFAVIILCTFLLGDHPINWRAPTQQLVLLCRSNCVYIALLIIDILLLWWWCCHNLLFIFPAFLYLLHFYVMCTLMCCCGGFTCTALSNSKYYPSLVLFIFVCWLLI